MASSDLTSVDMKAFIRELTKLFAYKESPSKDSGSSSVLIPSRLVHKLELMSNDIKLEGTKNYLSWSRRVLMILQIIGDRGYVYGMCAEHEDKSEEQW